jgi:hypothetical protein
MIRYRLACSSGHSFDGWFRSSSDYDVQAEKSLLSCPLCGSPEVEKALMAPAVGASEGAPSTEAVLLGEKDVELRDAIRKVRAEVTKNAQNVGPRFAEVARQMHDGEVERASVYGIASQEEVRALADDGVDFHPLPTHPDEGN